MVECAVNLSHPARAEKRAHFESAKPCAGSKIHGLCGDSTPVAFGVRRLAAALSPAACCRRPQQAAAVKAVPRHRTPKAQALARPTAKEIMRMRNTAAVIAA